MELAENEGAVKELVQKGEKMIEQLEKGWGLWVISSINDDSCFLLLIKITLSIQKVCLQTRPILAWTLCVKNGRAART